MRDGSRFRVRCYITGEFFLAAALASRLGGVGVISIGGTWIGIGSSLQRLLTRRPALCRNADAKESVSFGVLHSQNGARCEAHDAFCDAAEHRVLEPGQPARSHNDEVRFDFLGCQVDCQ